MKFTKWCKIAVKLCTDIVHAGQSVSLLDVLSLQGARKALSDSVSFVVPWNVQDPARCSPPALTGGQTSVCE